MAASCRNSSSASARRSRGPMNLSGLSRRRERARSTRKKRPLRHTAAFGDQTGTEVVLQRHLQKRVGQQLGVGGDAGNLFGKLDERAGKAPAQLAVLGGQQTAALGRFKDRGSALLRGRLLLR